VYKVGTVYAITGWLIIQVCDTVFPRLDLPEWTVTFVIVLVGIGFPVSLIFAWAFELTPEGLRRTEKIAPDQSISHQTGKKLNYWIIGALAAIIVFMGIERIWFATGQTTGTPAPGNASIAVLPFTDMSQNSNQQYLGDGIAEELLDYLARVPGLKVAPRTSSFSFRGDNVRISMIADTLDVSTVLEGSIRRVGDRINVTAQLIDAEEEDHLWSESYERSVDDIFAVQDLIARQIVQALKIQLGDRLNGRLVPEATDDPVAHQHVLRGRYYFALRDIDAENRQKAYEQYELATLRDPNYGDAWAGLGQVIAFSNPPLLDMENDEFLEKADSALTRALELSPDNPRALTAYALVCGEYQFDWAEMKSHLDRALEIDPFSAPAYHILSMFHTVTGDLKSAFEANRRARSIDPLNPTYDRFHGYIMAQSGEINKAHEIFDKYAEKTGQPLYGLNEKVTLALYSKDLETADELIREILKSFPEMEEYPDSAVINYDQALYIALTEGKSTLINKVPEPIKNNLQNPVFDESVNGLTAFRMFIVFYFLEEYDTALKALEHAYEQKTGLFAPMYLHAFLTPPFAFDQAFTSLPEYREFWNKPKLKELAELRKANGMEAGLPPRNGNSE